MNRTAFASALILLLASGCMKPPIDCQNTGDRADVSVATLGEYPTSISRIQLRDSETREVIWETRAGETTPQIWGFSLAPGANPSQLTETLNGRYEVMVPDAQVFKLEKGRQYEVSVWNKRGTRKSTLKLTL